MKYNMLTPYLFAYLNFDIFSPKFCLIKAIQELTFVQSFESVSFEIKQINILIEGLICFHVSRPS